MSDVTRILAAIGQGDQRAVADLLPLVYEELRRLAAVRMAQEAHGQTLQATALVHEAYLRLVDQEVAQRWDSRGHFFAAAAEAMRRILVERARRRNSEKHGGQLARVDLHESAIAAPEISDDILALDDALERFTQVDARAAELVQLRYFGGLTLREAAECLGIAPRTADDLWSYSRAWLYSAMK